jgi:hypothetical protein
LEKHQFLEVPKGNLKIEGFMNSLTVQIRRSDLGGRVELNSSLTPIIRNGFKFQVQQIIYLRIPRGLRIF